MGLFYSTTSFGGLGGCLEPNCSEAVNPKPPKTRVPMNVQNINSVDDMWKELQRVKEAEKNILKDIVRDFIDTEFDMEKDNEYKEYKTSHINNSQFIGDIVTNNERVVYSSLIVPTTYIEDKKLKAWKNSRVFEI